MYTSPVERIADVPLVEFDRVGRGARDRIMVAATALFFRDGIQATGVEQIIQFAHVSRRTFYQYFATKDELVQAYLRHLDSTRAVPLERALDTPGLSARDRLLAIFDGSSQGRIRGCPFHNAVVESADTWTEVHDIVHVHKRAFIDSLVEVCAELAVANPHKLGHQLAVIFEGGLALATTLNDGAPMVYARSIAEELISAASQSKD
jgi:AcrR family transcriptional regulator